MKGYTYDIYGKATAIGNEDFINDITFTGAIAEGGDIYGSGAKNIIDMFSCREIWYNFEKQAGEIYQMKQNQFKWKHFDKDIILLCVRWYLKYSLSYRDLKEMMLERGNEVSHTTILRWVHEYSPIIEEKLRKHIKLTNDSWRMDETYIRIKGKNAYLYRAVDSSGKTIDFYVSKYRDKTAARRFFKKALNANHTQRPRVITTDKYRATEIAIIEETYYGDMSCVTEHRMCQYLNNIIEQDHRFIKKKINPMLGFKSLASAEKTIAGIEMMHMIKKGQIEGIRCVQSEVQFINEIMSKAA